MSLAKETVEIFRQLEKMQKRLLIVLTESSPMSSAAGDTAAKGADAWFSALATQSMVDNALLAFGVQTIFPGMVDLPDDVLEFHLERLARGRACNVWLQATVNVEASISGGVESVSLLLPVIEESTRHAEARWQAVKNPTAGADNDIVFGPGSLDEL